MVSLLLIALAGDDPVVAFLERAEAAGQKRAAYRAVLRVRTCGEHGDGRVVGEGRVTFTGRSLLVELGSVRTLIRGSAVTVTRADGQGEGRIGFFHPYRLWHDGLSRDLLKDFEVRLERTPSKGALPSKLAGAVPSRLRLPPRASKVVLGGRVSSERSVMVTLRPREERLRKRFRELRLAVERDTYRVERIEVQSATFVTAYDIMEMTPLARRRGNPQEVYKK